MCKRRKYRCVINPFLYLLKTLSGIDRPALINMMPTTGHHNVFYSTLVPTLTVRPKFCFSMALWVLCWRKKWLNSISRVALLNVGEEDIKGNAQVKSADQLFKDAPELTTLAMLKVTTFSPITLM